jgi:integrase
MANKQIAAGGIRVYSRHSASCHRDAAYLKCKCPKWIQFQLAGKQVRESAETRSFSRAVKVAEDKAKELSGEATEITPEHITVEQAVQNWLAHRTQDGKKNEKARLVSDKLTAYCYEENISFLSSITRGDINALKLTLPFRSGNSNSLRAHLSILGGFFRWATDEAGYLTANPFPKFKIEFQPAEIVPPTASEINRVLAIESVRLFGSLMRWSGMAILDTITLKRDALKGTLITGRRLKTNQPFRVRIPAWLANELRAVPGDKYFFWDGKIKATSGAQVYRRLLSDAFKKAGVKMTTHQFRHFFISSTLATGVSVEDVSAMVGTSPNEIRKTYRHWIKEATDRLDEVQQQAWIKQGLDAEGNPREAVLT